MGCEGCSNNKTADGLPKGCKNNGNCSSGGCDSILSTQDWLSNIYYQDEDTRPDIIEVKFKGTRKGFYRNKYKIDLEIGDQVVLESASGGSDVGFVSLKSDLVRLQMKKYGVEDDSSQMLNVLRRAGERDVESWEKAKGKEKETMMKARQIASGLGLMMKISDVEYQSDLSKATFYYTADGRVDFRELIKVLARTFKIKVEMKQIGLRQEAGRLGGIGSCGRELCCSTWLTDFDTVPTSAARYQNLFINPQKLAGQCGRLKCCLNYELDTYLEALEGFPDQNARIQTAKGSARIEKSDILKQLVWLRYDDQKGSEHTDLICLTVDDFKKLAKSKAKVELESVALEIQTEKEPEKEYKDVVGEDSLSRFDKQNEAKKKKNKGRRHKNMRRKGGGNQNKKQES